MKLLLKIISLIATGALAVLVVQMLIRRLYQGYGKSRYIDRATWQADNSESEGDA